jgi:hypothetical protein
MRPQAGFGSHHRMHSSEGDGEAGEQNGRRYYKSILQRLPHDNE